MTSRATHALIVAERNSGWTRWAEHFAAPNVTVLVQRQDESLDAFTSRTRQKIDALEQALEMPQEAVVVGGGRTDHKAVGLRSTLVRAVTTAMSRHGGGLVHLDDAGPDRYAMAAIATTVSMLARGSGVRIRHAQPLLPHLAAA